MMIVRAVAGGPWLGNRHPKSETTTQPAEALCKLYEAQDR